MTKLKRIIITVALLLIVVTNALAAPPKPVASPSVKYDIDLAAMTVEELVALRSEIDQAIAAASGSDNSNTEAKEVTVPQGTYVIGVDIPAGTYTLEAGSIVAMTMVFETKDGVENLDGLINSYSISEGEPAGRVELKDGNAIQISLGSVVFKPYQGLGF